VIVEKLVLEGLAEARKIGINVYLFILMILAGNLPALKL